MRTLVFAAFAFTLSSLVADAQDSQPAAPKPLAYEVKGELPGFAGVPVVFSRDGKHLLYIKRERAKDPQEKGKHYYVRANADGSDPVELFETPLAWEDLLCIFVSPGAISADGKRVAAISCTGPYKSGNWFPQLLEPSGGVPVESKLGSCGGLGLAGESLIVLEMKPNWREPEGGGFSIERITGKARETIHSDPSAGYGLRVSPTGEHAALFVVDMATRSMKLRVVDLAKKTTTDTEPFRSDDFTWDGPPLFFWGAKGEAIYFNACEGPRGKRPFSLRRLDVKTNKVTVLGKEDANLGLTAVLDADHVALALRKPERHAAILRVSDQKLLHFEKGTFILGAHGKRLALMAPSAEGKGRVVLADVELPEKK